MLACARLGDDPKEVDSGSNVRVNSQRKGGSEVITRLDCATVPKNATIMAFGGCCTQVNDPCGHDKIMPLNMDASAITENWNLHGLASIPENRTLAFLADEGKPGRLNADPRGVTCKSMDKWLLMMPVVDQLLKGNETFNWACHRNRSEHVSLIFCGIQQSRAPTLLHILWERFFKQPMSKPSSKFTSIMLITTWMVLEPVYKQAA